MLKEHQSAANPLSLDCFEIKKHRCSSNPESCQAIMLTFIIWRIKSQNKWKMIMKNENLEILLKCTGSRAIDYHNLWGISQSDNQL